MMDIKDVLPLWFYTSFDKKTSGGATKSLSNQKLANLLPKSLIKNFLKRRVYSSCNDKIWDADLAHMQLISMFNKVIRFLSCATDIFSKYVWVTPLKDKTGITTVNAFWNILNKLDRKANKLWVDKDSEFYNRSIKSWLEENNIKMYSTHNEGQSAIAERFIRFLEKKIYKHITSISKNAYIDKLGYIVNKYNNTYHRTIKMKPIDDYC